MKSFLILIASIVVTQAQANNGVMLKCTNGNVVFDLFENGYTYDAEARITFKNSPPINLSCSEMMGRADNAVWGCSQNHRAIVTVYHDFKTDKIVAVTKGMVLTCSGNY